MPYTIFENSDVDIVQYTHNTNSNDHKTLQWLTSHTSPGADWQQFLLTVIRAGVSCQCTHVLGEFLKAHSTIVVCTCAGSGAFDRKSTAIPPACVCLL